MTEKSRKNIVYICFVLSIIFGLYHFSGDFKKTGTKSPGPEQKEITASRLQPSRSIKVEEYAALEWGPDPFYRGEKREVRQEQSPGPQWVLNGILYDDINPTAVINKKIVKAGDTIEGARVIAIGKKSVSIEYDGSRVELYITKDKS